MKVYIIIKHDTIGGSEKRFVGLWTNLVKQQDNRNIFLVLSQKLLNDLYCIDDFKETLKDYGNNIIIHSFSGNYFQNSVQAYRLLKRFSSPESHFHFIEFLPVISPLKSKLYFSITASNLGIYSFKGRLTQYIAALLANKIDILDPEIYKRFNKLFWFKRKNIFLTPCTYCNTDKFKIEEKKNWIVFLGIFTPIKQPLKYLKSIPAIYKKVQTLNLSDLKFFIFGTGELEAELLQEYKGDIYRNIPIKIEYISNPETILNKSKIFVSLQKFNNYPSKSLVEALSSGNLPIVTDNGHTRWIADEKFSYYVKEDFSETEIADQVFSILNLSKEEFEVKSNMAREFILENHNFAKMSNYYSEIFYSLSN